MKITTLLSVFIILSAVQIKATPVHIYDGDDLNYAICDNDADCIRVMQEDKNKDVYNGIIENYWKHKPSVVGYSKEPLIPQIIHQVWFNPPVPPQYTHYLNECKKLHPNWEFKVWDSESIKELGIDWNVFDQIRGYPARADVVRMAAMYKYGGIYRDMDTKCLRPLDELAHMYETFFSSNIALLDPEFHIEINSSLSGSKAENPMIKRILETGYTMYLARANEYDNERKFNGYHSLGVFGFLRAINTEILHNAGPKDAILLPHAEIFDIKKQFKRSDVNFIDVVKKLFMGVKPFFEISTHKDTLVISQKSDLLLLKHVDLASGFLPSVKKYIKKNLPKIEMRKYEVFTSYIDLDKYGFRNAGAPEIIHFVITNDEEQKILNENLESWRLFNPTFEIKIWDVRKDSKRFVANTTDNPEAQRIFLALQALNKEGGIYINYRNKAKRGVFEIVNKFDFAGGMIPLNRSIKQVSLSASMVSSVPNSYILSSALSTISPNDSYENIINKLTLEAYHKLLVGRNIVLPGIYFDPVDENRSKETLYDRVYRTLHGYTPLFEKSTYCSVVY